MDPALLELARRGEPGDEVAVILRLRDPDRAPRHARVVSRFGDIVTARMPRGAIGEVWSDDTTLSVKAPRDYSAELESWDSSAAAQSVHEARRPPSLRETGRGVVVGAVDWGCDVRHPDLRHPDGRTRLLALWDQRPAPPGLAEPFGYGRIHYAASIDAALRTADPYAALLHHPADFDPGAGAHGTHTVSIAAGNGRGGGPSGMAPEADLVFVNLGRVGRGTRARPLGDSVELLEAIDFITRVAAGRPCVINLSLGRHAGEHTGRTLVEMAMDRLLAATAGLAIIQSCGNYAQRRAHASWLLRPGDVRRFAVQVDPADRTTNEVDIWYPGRDTLAVEVASADGSLCRTVRRGERAVLTVDGRDVARAYHRAFDPQNGDHQCSIFIEPGTAARDWEVTLVAEDVVDGRVHAWIERDSSCRSCQSRFGEDDFDARTTIGTIANGYRTIVVGAYDAHSAGRPRAPFSSIGPTRDGREKPDIAAEGVLVSGARSTPREASSPSPSLYVRMSGTSMAAPAVAGTVALLFQAAGRPLRIEETRRLLLASCDPPTEGLDPHGLGNGYLNPGRVLASLRAASLEEAKMSAPTLDPSAAELFDAYAAQGAENLGDFSVVAGPSQPLQVPLRAGDVVIARARGVPFASLSVLAGPTLRESAELEPPGQYGAVLGDPSSGIPRTRRVLDLHGVVPSNTLILRPREMPPSLAEVTEAPAASGASYWEVQLRFGLAGNTVRPLVDGPDAFAAIQRAIETAVDQTHYIYLLGWWVDPWVNLTGPGTSLLDLFARASERRIQIRVLMWNSPALIPAFANHSRLHDAAEIALNRIPYCHAQQDAGGGLTSPRSHHQKLLVVNGRDGLVALCGGVDVNADRIHQLPPPVGAARSDRPPVGWVSASGSGAGGAGEPLHDVHALVTGPTALPLLRMFLRRWWARSGDRDIDRLDPLRGSYSQPVPPPTGTQFVRVGETFDGVLVRDGEPRVRSRKRDVQDIWLRALLGARRFVYMEEQYLSHLCAAEAIKRVLPRLEHVTILIPPSAITDFPGVWRRRRAFIDRITSGNPHAGKLHVYTRVVGDPEACRRDRGPHLYIHSKMAVIDDELALIGSANCNHRGWESDSELVLATFEAVPVAASTAARLRAQLWAHHLGVSTSAVSDPVRSRGLWDTAPTRQVCRYDPAAGRDSGGISERDAIADPTSRRSDDPCCALLRFCP